MSAAPDSATLLAALGNPACYPHAVSHVSLIETHISWVLLTGTYAYKIKKPVNLGFLNFTTLVSRRHFCEEELRLNRRLAPELYLEVVPITGTAAEPRIGGAGAPIEYAVKMHEFPQDCLFDNAVNARRVDAAIVAALARKLATFHASSPALPGVPADDGSAGVLAPAVENFDQLQKLVKAPEDAAALTEIRSWTLQGFKFAAAQFRRREQQGFIRECHGDLHLGNIVLFGGAAVPFDCLEFNRDLRWIDVINEVAFLMMDFEAHARRDLAYVFLNAWLEASGDYAGVACLPFYYVYRALVRAKVNLIRSLQPRIEAARREDALAAYRRYLDIALTHTRAQRGALIIMHGYSASGKSTIARELVPALNAVCIRSDVERKRLHELAPLARTGAGVDAGLYTHEETQRTYETLLTHARHIAGAGLRVIVDATFLQLVQRAAFHTLAAALEVPFAIIDLQAPPEVLRARLDARAAAGADASEATLRVLDTQMHNAETLTAEELPVTFMATLGEGAAGRLAREIAHYLDACESSARD